MSKYPKIGAFYRIRGYSESFNGCLCEAVSRDGEYTVCRVLNGEFFGHIVVLYRCELEEEDEV